MTNIPQIPGAATTNTAATGSEVNATTLKAFNDSVVSAQLSLSMENTRGDFGRTTASKFEKRFS